VTLFFFNRKLLIKKSTKPFRIITGVNDCSQIPDVRVFIMNFDFASLNNHSCFYLPESKKVGILDSTKSSAVMPPCQQQPAQEIYPWSN
jgi:hypothetical protein